MRMKSFTTLGTGFGAPCMPATMESWWKARNDVNVATLCQQIELCTDPEEQKKLKAKLPVWTPRCGLFRNHHRAQNDALAPLNRVMFDVDAKGHTDEILALMQTKDGDKYIGPFLILMVEESVRRGTHILVVLPKGMSLAEAQALFSTLINLPVDPAVKNVAGCIYLVPQDHVRYQSVRFFDIETIEEEFISDDSFSPNDSKAALPVVDAGISQKNFPTDYDGIPYPLLVECLANQLGGVPVHGSRNQFIFSMACHLRYVCNDDAQWIAQVLPTYGEEKERAYRTIQSACHRAQKRDMPVMVVRAISVARSLVKMFKQSEQADSTNPYCSPLPPAMPKRLPKLIKLLVSKVDPMYAPAVAQAVFAPLGAHLHGVRTRYIDNSESDLGCFMTVCMAPQSIGKGAVNMPIELIMSDIKERDEVSRQKEREWKQQCKSAKASEKKPARPADLCVQYLMSNMTNAALVLRLMDAQAAGNKYLYVKMDEIELLDQIKASGGCTASELIRLAFDKSAYGQERVAPDSITGTPPLRLCFNASTTIPSGQAYFANGLTDGTLSRISFSTIMKPEGRRGIPRFGNYDNEFKLKLQPFINNLNAASGLIECPQAERMANKLLNENYDTADLSGDDVFEMLSYRANRMAYDKALLLYIAQGYVWSKDIADFCQWSEQYDMWCKMHFFGQQMREKIREKQQPVNHGPRNILDLLPNRFAKHDLQAVHRAQGLSGDVMQLIYNWTSRGYIAQDEVTKEYIKTEKYLKRHKSIQP